MRTGRTNGTTTYTYAYTGGQLTQMTLNGETVTFGYDASGKPETMTYQGVTYYYVTNLQGDVVGIMDSNGNRLVYYYYTAYGTATVSMNSNYTSLATSLIAANPLTYRGYVYDQGTSLYYLQSRYYNPKIGRFLNADTLVSTGQGILGNNMFAYCLNNPVAFSDEQGTATKSCLHDSTEPRDPWRNSGSGGGIPRKDYRSGIDYGDLADKFYTIRFFRLLGEGLTALYDAYMRGYNIQQEAQRLEAQLIAEQTVRVQTAAVKNGTIAAIQTVVQRNLQGNKEAQMVAFEAATAFVSGYIAGLIVEIFDILSEAIAGNDA